MDFKKIILYAILALIAVTLWNDWMREHPPAAVKAAEQHQAAAAKAQHQQAYVPPTFNPAANQHTAAQSATPKAYQPVAASSAKNITVKTDVLDVVINARGGNVVSAKLLKYAKSTKQKNIPVQLLNFNKDTRYVADSSLTNIAKAGTTNAQAVVNYRSAKTSYTLNKGQKQLNVVLTGTTANGLQVTKTYTFKPNHYAIALSYNITNRSGKTWHGSMFNQVSRMESSKHHLLSYSRNYKGASMSTTDKPYQKLTFKDLSENNVSKNSRGGWVAMQQHYFLSAWVPNQKTMNHFYSHTEDTQVNQQTMYTVGYVTPGITVANGASGNFASQLYVGPEIKGRLDALAPHLAKTIDYGWLSIISEFLFWVLSGIHFVLGNWGWSIIVITILIKIVFYPLTHKSLVSMAKMRDLQPRIKALQERNAGDKAAASRAMMEIYRKEKINPMSGCWPMLIQIPVFIALYYVLFESVALRQAPFMFWIHDLSVKDPYYILPILMGVSMFFQQKMTPTPGVDPAQAKMMMLLPVIFTIFFLSFPAGLVLYWLTNNCLQILQQYVAMRHHERSKIKHKQTHK